MSLMPISMKSVSSTSCELHQQWGGVEAYYSVGARHAREPGFHSSLPRGLFHDFAAAMAKALSRPHERFSTVGILDWPPITPLRRIALPAHPDASPRRVPRVAALVKANDDMGLLDPVLLPDACPRARDLGNRISMVAE